MVAAEIRPATVGSHNYKWTGTGHHVTYHPDFTINPIPKDHRFPMSKDHLLYASLAPSRIPHIAHRPVLPSVSTLNLAHDTSYVEAFCTGTMQPSAMRQIGLPWTKALVRRTLRGVGSAVLAAHLALRYGVACTTNGGTHHAHPAHGSGWCIFNDLAVAARAVQKSCGVEKILMVDLDVH